MGFEVEEYIAEIRQVFMEKSNPENAKEQKDYMKGNFDFFGIKAKTRRKITREFMRKAERPDYGFMNVVIKKLWKLPEREYQYFAMELLEKYKKEFKDDIIFLFEYMITNKSWWDTVDFIAKKLVGEFFNTISSTLADKLPSQKKPPNKVITRLIGSNNSLLMYPANCFIVLLFSDTKRITLAISA